MLQNSRSSTDTYHRGKGRHAPSPEHRRQRPFCAAKATRLPLWESSAGLKQPPNPRRPYSGPTRQVKTRRPVLSTPTAAAAAGAARAYECTSYTCPYLFRIVGPNEGVSIVRAGDDLVGDWRPRDARDYKVVLLQHVRQAPRREAGAVAPLVDLQAVVVGAQREHCHAAIAPARQEQASNQTQK